jgi:hypothetical protein
MMRKNQVNTNRILRAMFLQAQAARLEDHPARTNPGLAAQDLDFDALQQHPTRCYSIGRHLLVKVTAYKNNMTFYCVGAML